MVWPGRLGKRVRDGLLAILGVAALGLGTFFALSEPRERPVRLRMTAGQDGGTRHRIALALQREAAQRAIAIELQPMAGSGEALQAVESGRVDAAFVQGGLDMSTIRASVRSRYSRRTASSAGQGGDPPVIGNLGGLRERSSISASAAAGPTHWPRRSWRSPACGLGSTIPRALTAMPIWSGSQKEPGCPTRSSPSRPCRRRWLATWSRGTITGS